MSPNPRVINLHPEPVTKYPEPLSWDSVLKAPSKKSWDLKLPTFPSTPSKIQWDRIPKDPVQEVAIEVLDTQVFSGSVQ